jgi:hypothetical protein
MLLLTGIYALGVFGILASSGDGSSSDRDRASSCRLVIQTIAPALDASNDVWIGVLSLTDDGNFDSVVRLNQSGSELLSFAISAGGSASAVRAIAIAADTSNDVYVGGDFSEGILRLNSDGTLDPGFAVGTGFNGRVATIVPLSNGDVYVGGFFDDYDGDLVGGLVRLNSDGSRDIGFNTAGAGVSNVESIALATDGSFDLYSGGLAPPGVERWSDTGVADTGSGGFNPPALLPTFSLATVPLPANEIYVGGTFTGHIVRLNSVTGNTDGGFIVGIGFDADVLSLELATAGDIYAGGVFTNYQGTSANGIVRLEVNGDRDFGFDVGSGFTDPNDPATLSKVASLAQAVDGTLDVYVGGGFSKYDGADSNGIARLNVDGSLDTGFAVQITADGETCSNQTI